MRGEKWQLTPAGSEAQPKLTVSVNPLLELRLMVTEVFCELAMETDGGVRVMAKVVFVVETDSGCEVEGEWELSPPYAAMMLEEHGARLGISVATPLAFNCAEPTVVEPLVKTTVPVAVGPVVPVTVATRTSTGLVPVVLALPRAVTVGMVWTTSGAAAVPLLPWSLASPA